MTQRTFDGAVPQCAATAFVDPSAVVIGDVRIGEHSSLWPMVVVRGDINPIRIGAYTNIQDGSVLHVTHAGPYTQGGYPLTIGDYVTCGHKAILHACTVGSYCLIGMGATVMDGAVVESGAILGAGSLVPPGKVLAGGHLWVGSPARKVRALSDSEREMLAYSARHYAQLKDRHLASLTVAVS